MLAGYNGQWRINSDSALYVELGRNLAEGLGYTYHGQPHTWVEPGLPYLIGITFRLFGIDNFYPVTALMVGYGALSLTLIYTLFCLHAGRPTAVLMTLLAGICENILRYNYVLFTDMPAFTGVMAFLVGHELVLTSASRKRWQVILGWLLLALGIWQMLIFRPIGVIFVGTVGLTTLAHLALGSRIGPTGNSRLKHAAIGLLVLACFLTFYSLDPRRSGNAAATVNESAAKTLIFERTGYMLHKALTDNLPTLTEEHAVEAVLGTQLGPFLSSAVSLAILASALVLFRSRPLWAMWVAVTVLQMLFWVPRERYFMPLMPILLFGIWQAARSLGSRLTLSLLAPAVVGLIAIANLIFSARLIIEQRRTPFLTHYEGGKWLQMIDLARELPNHTPATATILSAYCPRELSYFSHRTVASPLTTRFIPPTAAELAAYRADLINKPDVFVILPGRPIDTLLSAISAAALPPITEKHGRSLHRLTFEDVTPATLPAPLPPTLPAADPPRR